MNIAVELVSGSFGALIMLASGLLASLTAAAGGLFGFVAVCSDSEKMRTWGKRSFQACLLCLTLSAVMFFVRLSLLS